MSDSAAIIAIAAEAGVVIEHHHAISLDRLLALLARFNRKTNLVGSAERRRVLQEHVFETIAVAHLVRSHGGIPGSVIDVGAGGGMESLVLALLWPDTEIAAMEPRRKRADFIEVAADHIGVGRRLRVIRRSLDDRYEGPRYDVATSRATFAPVRWLQLAGSLVGPGGRIVVHADGRAITPDKALGRLLGTEDVAASTRSVALFEPRG